LDFKIGRESIMVDESVVEESIIALLQKQGYELVELDSSGWFSRRNLDDFINVELLEDCLLKINSSKERRIIEETVKKDKMRYDIRRFNANVKQHDVYITARFLNLKNPQVQSL